MNSIDAVEEQRTQVLVVGGGPVGAVAAYSLARSGIDAILI